MTGPSVVAARARSESVDVPAVVEKARVVRREEDDVDDVVSEFGGGLDDWIDDDNGVGMDEQVYGGKEQRAVPAWSAGSYGQLLASPLLVRWD